MQNQAALTAMREDYDVRLPLLHLQVQPECHEELHDALSGFLYRGVFQQDIVTPALHLKFEQG